MNRFQISGFYFRTTTTALFLLALASTVRAQVSFDLTDLGTLGGNSSSAASMGGQHGRNAAGMIVGTSKAADNSSRAFLYSNGQMSDLNSLCDLTKTNFAILTAATSIDDDGAIIGEGKLTDGKAHAFLLTPVLVDGGRWSYSCCNWVWKQVDPATGNNTGWWWEPASNRYNWHGSGGKHPACPPNPPHCWSWPLPCPPETGSTPYPTQTPTPTPSPGITPTPTPGNTPTPTPTSGKPPIHFPHNVYLITPTPGPNNNLTWCCDGSGETPVILSFGECAGRHGVSFATEEDARRDCYNYIPKWYCCVRGVDGGKGRTDGPISQYDCTDKHGVAFATAEQAQAFCDLEMKTDSLKTTIHPGSQLPLPAGTSNGPLTNPRFPNSIPSNSPGNLTPQNFPQNTPFPRVTPVPSQHGTPNPNITKGRHLPRLTPTPKGPPIHLRHPRPSPVPTAPVVR